MLATTVRQPRADGVRHCGCASARNEGGGKGEKRRTEVVYGVVRGHALSDACEDVDCRMRIKEGAAEVREVRDEDAWVELSLEEAETSVLEACLAQTMETEQLIDVCQLFRLQKSS